MLEEIQLTIDRQFRPLFARFYTSKRWLAGFMNHQLYMRANCIPMIWAFFFELQLRSRGAFPSIWISLALGIQVCTKNGISPTILFWAREGSRCLGLITPWNLNSLPLKIRYPKWIPVIFQSSFLQGQAVKLRRVFSKWSNQVQPVFPQILANLWNPTRRFAPVGLVGFLM